MNLQIKKDAVKKKLISQKIRKISFIVMAVLNALFVVAVFTLASWLGVAVLGTLGFTIGVSGLSTFNSILLFLAKQSDKIGDICDKYGLLNDQFELKLENLDTFIHDMGEIRSEIQSLKSENGGLNVPYPNIGPTIEATPRNLSARSIINETPRFKTRFDADTNIIYIEYEKV